VTRGSRLAVVIPFGGPGRPSPFVLGSLAAHLAFLLYLFLAPAFRARPFPIGDAIVVDVVGGLPESAPAAAPETARPSTPVKPPPRKPPSRPPKESSLQDLPKPKQKKKEDRPKREDPAPETPSEPVAGPPDPSPAPGGDPGGPSPSGSGGGVTSLDVGDVEFAWYRATVTAALKSRWVRPVLEDAKGLLAATVAFEVRRDGTVQNARVERASGVPVMDRSVLRAVLEASPRPPQPPTGRQSTLPARFEFRWRPGDPE
jgi:protein TonB